MNTIIKLWLKQKAIINIENQERYEKNKARENSDFRTIKKFINNKGITEIDTNKYSYNFIYNNNEINEINEIHFVNQTDRLVGNTNRILISDKERECVNDAYLIKTKDPVLYVILKNGFKYIHFCI